MKKLFFLFSALALLSLGIMACSDDDDDEAAKCTITFDANGGTISTNSQTIESGKSTKLTLATTLGPSYTNHTFIGWGTSKDATTTAYADGGAVSFTANITLYALWVDSSPVSANENGVYAVNNYNFYNTLKAIAEREEKEASFLVSGATNSWIPSLQLYMKSYTSVACTLDLSPSTELTSVGTYFSIVPNLVSITIPGSVKEIEAKAFQPGTEATGNQAPQTVNTKLKTVVLKEGVQSIGAWAFAYTKVENVTLPDTVTTIGGYAFYTCSYLESINIPSAVTSIGANAFNFQKFNDNSSIFNFADRTSTWYYTYTNISEGIELGKMTDASTATSLIKSRSSCFLYNSNYTAE